ncbi:hypothetical protein N836_00040 [Leptolyngbya sp. Heron Island J]|uniref:hypothetical protein n=1 Tax=Leptolyngbya sp. Heron Island J TaxID=1385935 RepID=UPI0003B9C981|nr:hypothetical protein [Leptolyngbya sp. Heron Island J]ESA39146.1 hypothetical protein N836_00040 [Leptolyngbya sp. Heron Island J]
MKLYLFPALAALTVCVTPAIAQVIPAENTPEVATVVDQEGYSVMLGDSVDRMELECRAYLAVSFPNGIIDPAYLREDLEATFLEAGRRGGIAPDTLYDSSEVIANRVGELMELSSKVIDLESGIKLQFLYEEMEEFVCERLAKG